MVEAASLAGLGFAFSKEGERHGKGGFVSSGWVPGMAPLHEGERSHCQGQLA